MKNPRDITSNDLIESMKNADPLEREILQQALHCCKTSSQWMIATQVYNKISAKK